MHMITSIHTSLLLSSSSYILNSINMEPNSEYQDLLAVMVDKLDADTFVGELCGGFRLLADPSKGLITAASLQQNCALLGLEGMSGEDAAAMVEEGNLDGDGALNQTEFCILMVRLSPSIMEDAETWLDKAINQLQKPPPASTSSSASPSPSPSPSSSSSSSSCY